MLASFLTLIIVVFITRKLWKGSVRRRTLPPGPTGLPVIGNLLQLEPDAWLQFTEWKARFGPIIYLNLAGQDVVVLNTNAVATELLEKRGAIYSDRPPLILACGILTEGMFFTFVRYGSLWRRMRRAAHEAMHRIVVKDYQPTQIKESIVLLDELRREPDLWEEHLKRNVASTVLSVAYNTPTLRSINDTPMSDISEFTERVIRVAFYQGPIVEYFPWLQYIPACMWTWKRDAQIWSRKYTSMYGKLFRDVKERVNEGDQHSSFVASVLSKQSRLNLSDKELSWLTASIAAGSETVAATMSWFVLAMLQHPQIQKKAQAQLDTVVGRSRLPAFEDMKDLPYIQALVRETLRWHSVDPLGMQHMSIQDDWYEGYFIPKNTICVANIWAMNRCKETYGSNAEEFVPERYLDKDGSLLSLSVFDANKEEGHVTFGFGRRICIGRHLANNSLLINIASMLWMYDILPALDDSGQPIIPREVDRVNQVLVVRPLPFKCRFIPRFEDSSAVLTTAKEEISC